MKNWVSGTRRVFFIAKKERKLHRLRRREPQAIKQHSIPSHPIPNPETLMETCFYSQCLLQVKVTLSSFRLLLAARFLTCWDSEALEGLY